MNMIEERQSIENIDKINDSGPELYKKLADLAKLLKQVLCAEIKEDMNNIDEKMNKQIS